MTANASDGAAPPASGVSAVRFEIKPSGAGSFSVFGTQTAPVVGSTYQQSLVTSGFAGRPRRAPRRRHRRRRQRDDLGGHAPSRSTTTRR